MVIKLKVNKIAVSVLTIIFLIGMTGCNERKNETDNLSSAESSEITSESSNGEFEFENITVETKSYENEMLNLYIRW